MATVPSTETFSLQNVYDAVKAHAPATTGDHVSCWANAEANYFDLIYNNNVNSPYPANSLLRFRNYGPSKFTALWANSKYGNIKQGGYPGYALNGSYVPATLAYRPSLNCFLYSPAYNCGYVAMDDGSVAQIDFSSNNFPIYWGMTAVDPNVSMSGCTFIKRLGGNLIIGRLLYNTQNGKYFHNLHMASDTYYSLSSFSPFTENFEESLYNYLSILVDVEYENGKYYVITPYYLYVFVYNSGSGLYEIDEQITVPYPFNFDCVVNHNGNIWAFCGTKALVYNTGSSSWDVREILTGTSSSYVQKAISDGAYMYLLVDGSPYLIRIDDRANPSTAIGYPLTSLYDDLGITPGSGTNIIDGGNGYLYYVTSDYIIKFYTTSGQMWVDYDPASGLKSAYPY